MSEVLERLWREEEGQDLAEYALLVEVVSKIPQHDFDASESDHTQEIVDVVLVAGNQAAKHLQPSEQTLDCPAPPIAA